MPRAKAAAHGSPVDTQNNKDMPMRKPIVVRLLPVRRLSGLIHRSLLCALAWHCLAPLAFAQDAPMNPATSPASAASQDVQNAPGDRRKATPRSTSPTQAVALGEVMVTANRRREPSREVPMHVDTIRADELRQTGARTLSDYASYEPGVFFASQGGSGQGELIMRGVSTGNETSPTVSVYLDDVPVGGSTVYAAAATFLFDAALLDLDRVEFLYGPQGTLYGAGSMGGLVKYVTNRPDPGGFAATAGFDFAHTQQAGGMSYSEHATVNLPLAKDVAALRVSLIDQHTAGVYRAVGETPAGGDDRTHTRGARVQLEVDPFDRLSFNLSAMAQKISADGLSMADYSPVTGQPMSGGPYNRRLNHREPFAQTLQLYAFRASYDFGGATLDWVTSYQNFVNRSMQDFPDGFLSLYNQIYPLLGADSALSSLYVDSRYDVHKASQEMRFTSPKGERFEWLAGMWFSREDVWEQYALQGAKLPPPGTSVLLAQQVDARYDEYAGYGDATWHISPTLDLAAGVRVSGNSQHLTNASSGAVTSHEGGFHGNATSQDVTGMVTLDYRPDRTHSYYARMSTGYRPGGLQAPVQSTIFGSNPGAKETYGSDALQSYEIGYKGSHLDGRLNVGVGVYDIEWHNMQMITYTVGNAVIENAGDARINGLEVQATYGIGSWQLAGSGTYTYARTLDANDEQGIARGARLPYSARAAATLSAKYNYHLAGLPAHADANLRLSSRRNAGFDNDSSDPNFKLPGYGMLDLDTGVIVGGGTSVNLYLRNAFDRRVPLGTLNAEAISFLATVGGPMLVQMSTPRTLGVSVEVPFE